MALVVKAIKPPKFDSQVIFDALQNEVEAVANDILLDFELTTATWKHKVKFQKLIQVGPNEVAAIVGTDDEIYTYVDKGTGLYGDTKSKYRIPKASNKTAKTLRFRSIYTAKTTPGRMVAGAGGSSGDFVFAKSVMHPGIKPRKFDLTIQKEWNKKFKRRMEKAMKDAARLSGYGA